MSNFRKFTWLTAAAIAAMPAFVFSAPAPAPAATKESPSPATQPTGAQEDLGAMEVTGQAKDKVNIEKPTPEIKIDLKELVDSGTDKTDKLLEKPKPIPSEEDFARFDRLASAQVARPWLPDLAQAPLIAFKPAPPTTTVKGWRLEVTDERGDVIQTITGKGAAVDEIIWDGTDKNKQMVKVNAAYSFRFITIDEYNNAHTTLGKAFNLKHVKYQDKKNLIVEISSKFLFKDEKLTADAMPILERTMDVLREYSQYPFSLEFQTEAPQGELVKIRQKALSDLMTKELLLPSESIKYTYTEMKERGDVVRFVIKLR